MMFFFEMKRERKKKGSVQGKWTSKSGTDWADRYKIKMEKKEVIRLKKRKR